MLFGGSGGFGWCWLDKSGWLSSWLAWCWPRLVEKATVTETGDSDVDDVTMAKSLSDEVTTVSASSWMLGVETEEEEDDATQIGAADSLRWLSAELVFNVPPSRHRQFRKRTDRAVKAPERRADPRRTLHQIGGWILEAQPSKKSKSRSSDKKSGRKKRKSKSGTESDSGESLQPRPTPAEARPRPTKPQSRKDTARYRYVPPNTPLPPELWPADRDDITQSISLNSYSGEDDLTQMRGSRSSLSSFPAATASAASTATANQPQPSLSF